LLRKFLLLDFAAGLVRNLIRDRGLWLRFVSSSPIPAGVPLPWDSLELLLMAPATSLRLTSSKVPEFQLLTKSSGSGSSQDPKHKPPMPDRPNLKQFVHLMSDDLVFHSAWVSCHSVD
jgi:hypothetical protein